MKVTITVEGFGGEDTVREMLIRFHADAPGPEASRRLSEVMMAMLRAEGRYTKETLDAMDVRIERERRILAAAGDR